VLAILIATLAEISTASLLIAGIIPGLLLSARPRRDVGHG
jgi:TRAP-type C4-dicarboxylate transport system permease large subunit